MTAKLAVGDKAPAFNLPRDGSGKVSLTSLKGKKLVLYFYPKDDTSGCTKEAIDFTALKAQFAKAGAEVIGVSPDPVKAHDKFVEKHKLGITLLSDESKEMLEAYGVWTEKSMYGRKYMGVERTTFLIGSDGKIAQIWNKVKVPGHAEEVLKAAKSL
jgi:peroxiredoxin Q/BCP